MIQQELPMIRVLETMKDISHKLLLEKQNGRNLATEKEGEEKLYSVIQITYRKRRKYKAARDT